MAKTKHSLYVSIDLDRPLTKDEYEYFWNRLHEWLFNEFQAFDDFPFGDYMISVRG